MNSKYILFSIFILSFSCKKQDDWLNAKANRADVTPQSLADYQAFLDRDATMNSQYPNAGLVSADNYYITGSSWNSSSSTELRNAYIWSKDIYEGNTSYNWNLPYTGIFYANTVLDGLQTIDRTAGNASDWDYAKGAALFYRSNFFYHLLGLYAKPYDVSSAYTDMGIPLRLSSDVNEKIGRQSTQVCYDRVLEDLKESVSLLPLDVSQKTRPAKLAALGLLAKVYLCLENYDSAYFYSSRVLESKDTLMDYNQLSQSGTASTFPQYKVGNPEILFYATMGSDAFLRYPVLIVDSALYDMYGNQDLRKTLFFRPGATEGYSFRGQYTGTTVPFSGIALDEIFLIHAECAARLGNSAVAISDMQKLLSKRYVSSTYIPISTGISVTDLLDTIIQERRKELPFTASTRWEDLRRLNHYASSETTLYRYVDNVVYSLLPNDARYVLPIPPDEITLTGIEQNNR